MIYTILVIVQVVVALALVALILVQHGKGADAGAAFGSGASGTVFGAKGSANFLSRATAALATVFFLSSLSLAYLVNGESTGSTGSVTDQLSKQPPAKTSTDTGAAASTPAAGGDEAAGQDSTGDNGLPQAPAAANNQKNQGKSGK